MPVYDDMPELEDKKTESLDIDIPDLEDTEELDDLNDEEEFSDEEPDELADEDNKFDRVINRINDLEKRLSGGQEPTQQSRPPVAKERIQTVDDAMAYLEWQLDQKVSHGYGNVASDAARHASSEQQARGLLSKDSVGKGRDFDSVIGKYVSPMLAQSPALNDVFNQFRQPALAQYFFGLIMHVNKKYGDNPTKAAKAIFDSLGAEKKGGKDIVNRIKEAEKRGLRRSARNPGKRQASKKRSIEEDMLYEIDNNFDAFDRKVKQGLL